MSTSTSQVPVIRHNQRQNIPSARVTLPQQYPQQQQQPPRYNNHVIENNSTTTMNYTQGSPSTPPRTPRRAAGNGPDRNATVESATESGPESQIRPPRSNRRQKPKNPVLTPAARRFDQSRGTPPVRMQSDGSAKPIPTQTAIAAYAGPTFHASPAPSALPIPSFYSKSVPDSPSMQEASKANNDQDSSSASDSPPSTAPGLAGEPNLLDMLFNPDRGENERARSAQSDVGPFRPPSHSPANGVVTPIQGRQRPPIRSNHGSASSLFKMEMDGYQGQPYGAGLGVTPYHERINAARSTPASLSSSPSTTNVGPQNGVDQSEALRALLFNNKCAPSAQPTQPLSPFQNAPPPVPYQNSPQNGYQNGYQNQNNYQNGYQNGPRMSSPAANNMYNSPQQQRYPYQGPGNGYRNSPRTSGLRQEVSPFRSPNSASRPTSGLTNGMFAPPQVSLNYKENSASGPRGPSVNMTQNPEPRTVSQPASNYNPYNKDIESMEDKLRNMLKISPTSSGVPSGSVPNASF